ncbi:MAG: hypothetical protein ACP5OG_05545 [Candidatus Nanoarchaeia archaeon]
MIKLLIGLILLLFPFVLVNRFEDKKRGFYIILFFIIAMQFLIGFFTQLFGVFRYYAVLWINLIINLGILGYILYKGKIKQEKNSEKIKIDTIFVFVLAICIICLYSVHFNYTGIITTVNEAFINVENFKYIYPYFSDEWTGVSFISYSIREGKLPFVNPLWYNEKFSNIGFSVYSLGAELMLLTGLNPLTEYIVLSFFSGLLICVLVYFILRENNASSFSSGIAAIFVLYITRGANLPGIWTFIPLIGGVIFLLFSILFLTIGKEKLSIFSGFLSIIFYPPLIIFLGVLFFSYYCVNKKTKNFWKVAALIFGAGIFLALLSLYFFDFSFQDFFSFLSEKIFYPTFTKNAIPDFLIFLVINPFILVFSLIGIIVKFKSKLYLVLPIFAGIIYWVIYSRVLWRFIIEYERVVFTTSLLIVLFSGFGLDFVFEKLKKWNSKRKFNFFRIIQAGILIMLLILSFFYTEFNNWYDLKLYSKNGKTMSPAAPANAYLNQEDIKLFENISKKRFITSPWKGLVIGAATNNYPLESKSSTIGNNIYSYSRFNSLDCEKKAEVSKEYSIDYVYAQKEINCSDFKYIGKSKEGFILYRFED